jgi:hypothetical protein
MGRNETGILRPVNSPHQHRYFSTFKVYTLNQQNQQNKKHSFAVLKKLRDSGKYYCLETNTSLKKMRWLDLVSMCIQIIAL